MTGLGYPLPWCHNRLECALGAFRALARAGGHLAERPPLELVWVIQPNTQWPPRTVDVLGFHQRCNPTPWRHRSTGMDHHSPASHLLGATRKEQHLHQQRHSCGKT
jgi:hypothetical protein